MKLNQFILAIFLVISVAYSQNPKFQCPTTNSCSGRQLGLSVKEAADRMTSLVKRTLTDKITELEEYQRAFEEFVMSSQVGEYLADRLSMGLLELQESNTELRDNIRRFILSADSSEDYARIISQLKHHRTVVVLQEFLKMLQTDEDSDVNHEIARLIRELNRNKNCVLEYIRDKIQESSYTREVARITEMLSVFLTTIRVVAEPREYVFVIQNLREVLARFKLGTVCHKIWLANIGCRSCNDTTGVPLKGACRGLCSTTVWVCLAPLLESIRRADDVITYKRVLVQRIINEDSSTSSDTLPSIGRVAEELEGLTRRAIQSVDLGYVVSSLSSIGRKCFGEDVAVNTTGIAEMIGDKLVDSVTTSPISSQSGDRNDGDEMDRTTPKPNDASNTMESMTITSPTSSKSAESNVRGGMDRTTPKPVTMDTSIMATSPPPPPDSDSGGRGGGRGRREVSPTSVPIPPLSLYPNIVQIVSTVCRGRYSTSSITQCWNGTHVSPFRYNLVYNRPAGDSAFQAAGVEYDDEEYSAEIAAISGSTNPCEGIQGESQLYYSYVSNSTAVCSDVLGNGSSSVTVSFSLLIMLISLLLLQF